MSNVLLAAEGAVRDMGVRIVLSGRALVGKGCRPGDRADVDPRLHARRGAGARMHRPGPQHCQDGGNGDPGDKAQLRQGHLHGRRF